MTSTTRRAILGAIASTPVLAVSCAPQPAAAATIDRADWDRKFAIWQKAHDIYAAAGREYDLACAAWKADCPREDEADFYAFPFENRTGVLHNADLDRVLKQLDEGEGVTWWSSTGSHRAKTIASVESVRDWRRRWDANVAAHDWVTQTTRIDRLLDELTDAHDDALVTPAPDREALLWKLEELYGEQQRDADGNGASWSPDLVDSFMADARRLLGGEG